MRMDVREFLKQFSVRELAVKGILRGETRLLTGRIVSPLIELMAEQGVTRLEALERTGF